MHFVNVEILLILLNFNKCINIEYDQEQPKMYLYDDVGEDNICYGYFRPNGGTNCTYRVIIKSLNGEKAYYKRNKLIYDVRTWFSFKMDRRETIEICIEPISLDGTLKPFVPSKIEFRLEYNLDTFSLECAKEFRIKPAVAALQTLEEKIKEIEESTAEKINATITLHNEYGHFIYILFFCSLLCLVTVAAFNIYETIQVKKFLKQKKLL